MRTLFGALFSAFLAFPAVAAPICIINTFEVAWVHPGILFYANPTGYACEGASIRVKQNETGCFFDDEAEAGEKIFLTGEHAVDGSCIPICETEGPSVTVVFDLSSTYACAPE